MIEEYKFKQLKNLNDDSSEAKSFAFKKLDSKKLDSDQLNSELRLISEKSFKVFDAVKEHRGYQEIENERLEKRVISQVDIKLAKVTQEAKDKGYQEGLEKGLAEGRAQAQEELNEEMQSIVKALDTIKAKSDEYVARHLQDWHRLIQSAVKWISLKEVRDIDYTEKLLNKLVHELGERDHLLIRVDEKTNENILSAIEKVEKDLGKLANIRIEVEDELSYPSIIVEGQNGIIDGGIDAQFETLDQIFSTLGGHESES